MSQAKIGTCECCGYESIEVRPYTSMREDDIKHNTGQSTKWLCRACSHTYISNFISFPSLYSDESKYLAEALAWLYNDLMTEIKRIQHDNEN